MKNTIKRHFCGIIALLMLLGCFTSLAVIASAEENDNIVITIDPGHGGSDPGNTKAAELYGGYKTEHYESHHVYDISTFVKERLLQYMGVTVYLTRDDLPESAEKPSLSSRPNMAKEYNSDAFVSIHTNAYNTTAYGAEVHVPDKSISFNNEIALASREAANSVLSSMTDLLGIRSRGVKSNLHGSAKYENGESADKLEVIRVGRKNGIPVVMLVETAFADNQNDFNNYLSTIEKRKEMGYAIADGLAAYYDLNLISHATTPYFCGIEKINGVAFKEPVLGNLDGGVITINAKNDKINVAPDKTFSINGWMGAEGGISSYYYSIDHGTWTPVAGGTDGEPSENHYADLGLFDAISLGMFREDHDKLLIDLSNYEGQNITITFAARSKSDPDEIIPFLHISNYNVPFDIPTGFSGAYGVKLSSIPLPSGWFWADPDATPGDVGINSVRAIFVAGDSTTHNVNLTVTVDKATPPYSAPKDVVAQFKSKLSDTTLPEGWAWENGDVELNTAGEHKFYAVFTPEDTNNYISIRLSITVTVACIEHIYDNSCDTLCECGFVRDITHTFDNACDGECNVCSFTRTPAEHIYGFPCDTHCDICSFERDAADHEYEDPCDVDCNTCGEERVADHVYDNTCDAACNACGKEREITHTYAHTCDAYCDVCSFKRTVNNHTYSNSCDPYCDICSFKRTPKGHTYTNDCDAICNVCTAQRDAGHKYDNDCDAVCNSCGEARAAGHTYDNACDDTCNICLGLRDVSHTFDSDNDAECNICGAERTVENENTVSGCTSNISSVFAIITSIAIGFAFTKKKK